MIFLRWLCGIVILSCLFCTILTKGLTIANILIVIASLVFVLDAFLNKKKNM